MDSDDSHPFRFNHELVTVLELIHASLSVNGEEEFKFLLSRVEALIPSTHTIICLGKIDAETRFQSFMKMINISYPLDWISLYTKEDYAEVDPILQSHTVDLRPRFGLKPIDKPPPQAS